MTVLQCITATRPIRRGTLKRVSSSNCFVVPGQRCARGMIQCRGQAVIRSLTISFQVEGLGVHLVSVLGCGEPVTAGSLRGHSDKYVNDPTMWACGTSPSIPSPRFSTSGVCVMTRPDASSGFGGQPQGVADPGRSGDQVGRDFRSNTWRLWRVARG